MFLGISGMPAWSTEKSRNNYQCNLRSFDFCSLLHKSLEAQIYTVSLNPFYDTLLQTEHRPTVYSNQYLPSSPIWPSCLPESWNSSAVSHCPVLTAGLTSNPNQIAVAKLEELDQTASGGGGTSLTISGAKDILGDCHEGDSISVNGSKKAVGQS
jgi:hypothetical protein